jgi:hypothetical protein
MKLYQDPKIMTKEKERSCISKEVKTLSGLFFCGAYQDGGELPVAGCSTLYAKKEVK